MRDFQKFIEKNRREMYAVAYGNCKHDEEGHCIFPKDDPWMNDTVWDTDQHINKLSSTARNNSGRSFIL